ncbi:esterase-like activity of phytase family protein [Fictibacillus sp. B-59209]|uniref:esterase-like activity of phytase family protein n=1 Tax=Fictibacillus sp. B-59209 TaxID=3024873 RepID=UPI002E2475D4|nr:esterase-like activity of phytase family protein [Fictibacillus sp. B-59209]
MNKKIVLTGILTFSFLSAAFAYTHDAVTEAATSSTQVSNSNPVVKERFLVKNPPDVGNGIKAGMGSSLTHLPGDPDTIFYTTADRGPNGEVVVNGEKRRTFPVPTYTPRIYKIKVSNGKVEILKTIKLKLPKGTDEITGNNYISGVSNLPGLDETPYDEKGEKQLPYDPYGLDTEGLAYSPKDDTFWLSDEYRPSLVQVKRDGTILQRLLPSGMSKQYENAPNIPVKDSLPAVFSKRISNKGLEGVTISPDGKWMFALTQRPLGNPDEDTSNRSRALRILKINLETLKVAGEYVYLTDDEKQYNDLKQSNIYVSDLYAKDDHTLLVDERDSFGGSESQVKKIYQIDLSEATNIQGKYNSPTGTTKSLEQMTVDEMEKAGIAFPKQRLVVDMLKLGYPFEKLEGLTMTNDHSLAVMNDNDFSITNTSQNGTPTELWKIGISN